MYKPEIGERIYYTGDVANNSAWGTVTAHTVNRWGEFYEITYDDGGVTKGIYPCGITDDYQGHCGFRFATERSVKAYHDKCTAQYQDLMKKNHPEHWTESMEVFPN